MRIQSLKNSIFFLTAALMLVSSSFAAIPGGAWDLNDVAVLLPLPRSLNDTAALLPTTQGRFGQLLSLQAYSLLPLITDEIQPNEIYSHLRVVGLRIDPCFPDGSPAHPMRCHTQIRMVWQPIVEAAASNGSLQVQTKDAAIHSFYELSEPEFREFAARLMSLKQRYGVFLTGRPLGQVHPAFLFSGGNPAFANDLIRLVLSYTGAGRLIKFTFMTGLKRGTQWDFGGYDVSHGSVLRSIIPRVNSPLQTFVISNTDRTQFLGGIQPAPMSAFDNVAAFVANSMSFFQSANETSFNQSLLSINRIENPRIHSPQTMDCASCHVAQAAKGVFYQVSPQRVMAQLGETFTSRLNLRNDTVVPGKTDRLRAFGYFNATPSISQRVINDSAVGVELMNRYYLAR